MKIRDLKEKVLGIKRSENPNDTLPQSDKVTTKMVVELDEATIEYCKDEGNRQIDGLIQVGNSIRNKSLAFLGIMTGALITLIGTLSVLIDKGDSNGSLFFLDLYGIMALGIVSYRLISGILYKREYKISGDKPARILYKDAIEYAPKKAKENNHSIYKYIVAQQLNQITAKINFNRRENQKMQQCFKSCIIQIIVFIIPAVPILICFLLYNHWIHL